MEKANIEPPEEEEEEKPIVNGNDVAVTPGQPRQQISTDTEANVSSARQRSWSESNSWKGSRF